MPQCDATLRCHTRTPTYDATWCHNAVPHVATCVSLTCHFALSDRRLNGSLAVPLSDPTMLQISHLISVTGTTGGTPFTQYKIDFFLLQISGMLYLQKCFLLCDAVVGAVKTYCNVVLRCFLATLCYISWDATYHASILQIPIWGIAMLPCSFKLLHTILLWYIYIHLMYCHSGAIPYSYKVLETMLWFSLAMMTDRCLMVCLWW